MRFQPNHKRYTEAPACRCAGCPWGQVSLRVDAELEAIERAASGVPWDAQLRTPIENRISALVWVRELLDGDDAG